MTTQHTPGPWMVSHNASDFMGNWKTNPYSIVVPAKGVHRTTIANIPNRKTIPEDQKRENAFLIAAAPDLLDALKRVMPFIDCISAVTREEIIEYESAMKMADAAIKKATGQE